jgi:hypothetical protein
VGTGGLPAQEAPPAVKDLAFELEYDVDRIYRFVTDEIRYEPYEGILRGVNGTLEGRAGNSADKALLLAALLSASAIPVRFVRGGLPHAAVTEILSIPPPDAEATRNEALEVTQTGLPLPDLGADETPEIRAELDRIPAVAREVQQVAERQLDTGIATIVDALTAAGVSVPSSMSTLPARERDLHVWVQYPLGEAWMDLDPTLPGTEAGVRLAEPTGEPLDQLPDELRHRVQLLVTTERIAGGGLVQEEVIDHTAFADELIGVPIIFLHEKPGGLDAMGVALGGLLTGGLQYQPILQVGQSSLVGLTPIVLQTGGGLLDEIDPGAEGSLEGQSTAEWLDLRVVSPSGVTSTTRRTVFDRVGEAVRASGTVDPAAVTPVELVDLDDETTDEWVPLRSLWFLAVATGAVSGDTFSRMVGSVEGPESLAPVAHLYHMARDGMSAMLTPARGIRTFLDAPNVAAWRYTLEGSSASDLVATLGLDLLHRSFGQLPVAGRQPQAPPGVIAGVMSHVAERVAGGAGLPPDVQPDGPLTSVGAIFEEAAAQGLDVVVLREPELPVAFQLGPEAASRLRAALEQGWVAIVPERPVMLGGREELGWWLVDPATGRTIDELAQGGGANYVEHSITVLRTLWGKKAWVRFGICLALFIKSLSMVLKVAKGDVAGFLLWFGIGIPLHGIHGLLCH